MLTVTVNNKHEYQLPENWNELTARQLLSVSVTLLRKKLSIAEQTIIALTIMGFGNRYYTSAAQRIKGGYDYFAAEVYDHILPRLQWLFEQNTLTAQLLPKVKVPGKWRFFGTTELYGPLQNFDSLTIGEFSDTEACLKQFEATRDELWLNRFLAILYRPKQKNPSGADVRIPYNFYMNDLLAVQTAQLKPQVKAAILLWYYGCHHQLAQENPWLFNAAAKTDTGTETATWTDVIHQLSGAKFGNIDETARQPLKVILHEMYLNKKQESHD